MITCRKDERLPHEKSMSILASKGVGLSFDIWLSRKGLFQNIYLVLDLSYHKCNPFITAAVDGSIFKKILGL